MVFDDFSEEFFAYQQSSFDSPDLRPISLPMTGYDKTSLEGMINLSTAGTAFPNSNAFGHYLQPPFSMQQLPNSHIVLSHDQETEPEYYSDNEYYPADLVEQQNMLPMQSITHDVVLPSDGAQQQARKRKASTTPEYIAPHPQKKAAITQLKLQDVNGEYHDLSGQPSPYSSVVPTPGNNMAYCSAQESSSPRPRHQYSTSNASQISLPAPSPLTPAWSPSFTTVQTEQSPGGPMTPAPRPASTSTQYNGEHPKLVRTSTIPQQASPSLNPPASAGAGVFTHAFNPYTVYPQSKANLVLHGDLDGVALEWSAEELEAHRKLIVFTRSQTGSTINAEFKAVPPQDWQRGDITVNCIWWKERKEAFVTSVDTIALLEQLVAVRFTVEEKNRIRRNLEGFRPLTVSKAKADSEEFFKVIMGFPNPKPRNIEKDVKVFPWKILAHALKKIIGKYSASYASTASTINTPCPSTYASTEHSGDYHLAPSPHHEMMSTVGMPAVSMPAACYEPVMPGRLSAPVVNGVPDLSVQVPGMSAPYEMMPHAFEFQQMPMVSHAMTPHPATAPVDRMQTGWGYASFDAQHMGPMSAPPTGYLRGHLETGGIMAPAYHMHQR